MSYDLVVFDPALAPTEPSDFLKWYEQQSEESLDSEELASPNLRAFFAALSAEFPAMNGPHAVDEPDNPKVADYSFGQSSIYMCFAWSQATEARRTVAKLAEQSAVGFYDISDPGGFVWWPPHPGQFGVFYCFHGTNEEVSSDLPLSLDLPDVSKLVPKLASESDFIGIVDSNGVTVQFMLHKADNRVWMEIPAPEMRGSYGTFLSPGDLLAKIEALPSQFSISSFPELSFQSWDASPTKKPWWKFWS